MRHPQYLAVKMGENRSFRQTPRIFAFSPKGCEPRLSFHWPDHVPFVCVHVAFQNLSALGPIGDMNSLVITTRGALPVRASLLAPQVPLCSFTIPDLRGEQPGLSERRVGPVSECRLAKKVPGTRANPGGGYHNVVFRHYVA